MTRKCESLVEIISVFHAVLFIFKILSVHKCNALSTYSYYTTVVALCILQYIHELFEQQLLLPPVSLLPLRVVLEIELDSQEVFEREVFERGFLDRFYFKILQNTRANH